MKNGACPTCPLTGCPIKRVLGFFVVCFAMIVAFEWVYHGVVLMPVYEQYQSLWRSSEEMENLCGLNILRAAILSFAVAGLFALATKQDTSCKQFIVTGFFIGLLAGIISFGFYIWMPLPLNVTLAWLGGDIFIGTLIGAVLGWMKKRCADTSCTPTNNVTTPSE